MNIRVLMLKTPSLSADHCQVASMNALVPDFAMVPRLLISSFLVMPMPESSMVKVEFVLSGIILIKKVQLAFNLVRIRDGLITDLVQGI